MKIVVTGGTAGPFTAIVPGWPFPNSPARLVLKKIRIERLRRTWAS